MSALPIRASFILAALLATAPAQTPIGSGCGPYAGPVLSAASAPVRGTLLNLHSEYRGSNQPLSWFVFGSSAQVGPFGPLPTDLGLFLPGNSGCNLFVSADLGLIGPLQTGGSHSLMLPLPNNAALLGLRFFCQQLAVYQLAPLLLYSSNGLDITIL